MSFEKKINGENQGIVQEPTKESRSKNAREQENNGYGLDGQ